MSLEDIEKLYPRTVFNDSYFIVPITKDVYVSINTTGENIIAWNDKGTDYEKVLEDILLNLNKDLSVNSKNKVLLILQHFRDHLLGGAYGMDQNDLSDDCTEITYYDALKDNIWTKLKNKFNVDTKRKLHIYTYGTSFLFDSPKSCQATYNAAVLRGSHKKHFAEFKELVKLRGTDLQIQQEIRECPIFYEFVEDIVKDIESKNLRIISITCRAGHHRSVACAEMLIYLYPK